MYNEIMGPAEEVHLEPINQIAENESISRVFWRYAMPSIAAMVVNGLYQVIDGIFVGHYVGFEGLAGINMTMPIIGVIIGFGIMTGMGGGCLMSISRGEGNTNKPRIILVHSLWIIILLAAISMLLIDDFGESLLNLQGAEGNTFSLSLDYINIFIGGAGFTIAGAAIPILIRNDGSPNFSTGLMIFGALVNIVFDYVLIGVYSLGLQGAAIATVTAQLMVAIIGLGYFLSSRSQTRLSFYGVSIDFRIAAKILSLGASTLFMFLYFSLVVALHNKLFMAYGSSVNVGAFTIVCCIAALYYFTAEGLANGMQPPLSFYFGAKQPEKVKAIVLLAVKFVILSGIVTILVLNITPELFIKLFSHNDPQLLAETKNGIRLHLFGLFFDGFLYIATIYFMSVDQSGKALAISVGNIVVQLPLLYFLPQWLGINGIWVSLPTSNVILTLIVAPALWRDIQKSIRQTPSLAKLQQVSCREY